MSLIPEMAIYILADTIVISSHHNYATRPIRLRLATCPPFRCVIHTYCSSPDEQCPESGLLPGRHAGTPSPGKITLQLTHHQPHFNLSACPMWKHLSQLHNDTPAPRLIYIRSIEFYIRVITWACISPQLRAWLPSDWGLLFHIYFAIFPSPFIYLILLPARISCQSSIEFSMNRCMCPLLYPLRNIHPYSHISFTSVLFSAPYDFHAR